MKANELRIGNWVNAIRYRDDSGEFYPTQLETLKKGWGTLNGKSSYSICINHGFYETGSEWGQTVGNENEVKPIPLTEEWLVKLGFEKIEFNSESEGYGYEFNLDLNDNTRMSFQSDMSFGIENKQLDTHWLELDFDKFDGVHQLQNLYFALTGKELTLKDNE